MKTKSTREKKTKSTTTITSNTSTSTQTKETISMLSFSLSLIFQSVHRWLVYFSAFSALCMKWDETSWLIWLRVFFAVGLMEFLLVIRTNLKKTSRKFTFVKFQSIILPWWIPKQIFFFCIRTNRSIISSAVSGFSTIGVTLLYLPKLSFNSKTMHGMGNKAIFFM